MAHGFKELSKVSIRHLAGVLASECPTGGARLEQFAKATVGPKLYSFAQYDYGDHAEPPGFNPQDIEWVLARKGETVDLSPIPCHSLAQSFFGEKAQARLSQVLETQGLKLIERDHDGRIALRFRLPSAETLIATVTATEAGSVSGLTLQTVNRSDYQRTSYKQQSQLSLWAAKGPTKQVRMDAPGELRISGDHGETSIKTKHLCCTVEDGEDAGNEACSNMKRYHYGGVCREYQKPSESHR